MRIAALSFFAGISSVAHDKVPPHETCPCRPFTHCLDALLLRPVQCVRLQYWSWAKGGDAAQRHQRPVLYGRPTYPGAAAQQLDGREPANAVEGVWLPAVFYRRHGPGAQLPPECGGPAATPCTACCGGACR